MTRGEEDYIKTIYQLSLESVDFINNQLIASKLDHAPQTVIEMVKKLQQKELVTYVPYKGTKLTKKGKEQAIRLTRAHRLWELFLTEKLGIDWSLVHEEAELLEHVTSLNIEKKLYEFLDRPKACPHGDPIPDLDGNVVIIDTIPITDMKEYQEIEIIKISDNKELLAYMDEIGLKIGDQITIIKKEAFDGPLTIRKENNQFVIGYKASQSIYGKYVHEELE